MRVNINHFEEEQGWFNKTTYYGVKCDVIFSEEELHIIETNKLEQIVVLERDRPAHIKDEGLDPETWFLRIGALVAKHKHPYMCASTREAKEYEINLVKQLKELKRFIMENAEIEEKSQSFEL